MVALPPEHFKREVRATEKLVDNIARDVVGVVVGSLYSTVAMINPVLTGHSRGNWKIGVGKDPGLDIQPNYKGAPQGPITAPERTRIRNAEKDLRRAPVGTSVAIVNRVNYVHGEGGEWQRYLDNGSSKQAPNGIVNPALAKALGEANAAIEVLLQPLELF